MWTGDMKQQDTFFSGQGLRPDLTCYFFYLFQLVTEKNNNCIQMLCGQRSLCRNILSLFSLCIVNTLGATQNARITSREPSERTLTENISSWIELVVFLFFLFFFLRKFLLLSLLSPGANVDLSIIVKRLLVAPRRGRCDWFWDNIFDVLAAQLTSQNARPHLGVWDSCRQGRELD